MKPDHLLLLKPGCGLCRERAHTWRRCPRCRAVVAICGGHRLTLTEAAARHCGAPSPRELGADGDVVGPDADDHIDAALCQNGDLPVVAAWGVPPTALAEWFHHQRLRDVLRLVDDVGRSARPLMCLGTTKHGHPRHPLYVRGDQPLEPWRRTL